MGIACGAEIHAKSQEALRPLDRHLARFSRAYRAKNGHLSNGLRCRRRADMSEQLTHMGWLIQRRNTFVTLIRARRHLRACILLASFMANSTGLNRHDQPSHSMRELAKLYRKREFRACFSYDLRPEGISWDSYEIVL